MYELKCDLFHKQPILLFQFCSHWHYEKWVNHIHKTSPCVWLLQFIFCCLTYSMPWNQCWETYYETQTNPRFYFLISERRLISKLVVCSLSLNLTRQNVFGPAYQSWSFLSVTWLDISPSPCYWHGRTSDKCVDHSLTVISSIIASCRPIIFVLYPDLHYQYHIMIRHTAYKVDH